MNSRITPAIFENLKRVAARVKRETAGMTHSEALDRVAQSEGYRNWSLLSQAREAIDSLNGGPAITKPFEVRLSGFSTNRHDSDFDIFHEYVPTVHPANYYSKLRTGPHWQDFVGANERGVRERIATIRRAIQFMDATGLRFSTAYRILFKTSIRPQGFDHTKVWIDDQRRYIVTTEPYTGAGSIELALKWCNERAWDAIRLPRGLGIWNPCQPSCSARCTQHTEMIVMSPGKKGGDLMSVVAGVNAASRH